MVKSNSLSFRVLPLLVLGLLSACGGGGSGSTPTPPTPTPSTPSYATVLHYTSPGTNGFRLEAEPTTNDTAHLVLNLTGPTGSLVQGVAFFLTCDSAVVNWASPVGNGSFAKAGPVLDLTQGTIPSAQLFKSKVSSANAEIQVGIFQKNGAATLPSGGTIVSVALDLFSKTIPSGTPVHLASVPGKQAIFLDAVGGLQPMNGQPFGSIAVGALTAR